MTDENRKTGSERPGPVSVYDIRAACPGLGHAMFVLEAFRIRDLFRHSTLAVLSVFRRDRSSDDNYAEQARLSRLLRERGVAHLAAVGRWPGVGTRGLLLREVSQEQTRALAAEFGLRTYLWSVRGRWAVYLTRSNWALAAGEAIRIDGPEVGWNKATCYPESGALPTAWTTFRILGPDDAYPRRRPTGVIPVTQ